jgi:uncharacterized protein involved in response to NO
MIAATAERMREWQGPAVLSYGFRPLFLAAGFWAAFSMILWVAALTGWLEIPNAFTPLDWHVHELVYGFVPAVVAGFLLTAVPNWTGRLPVVGWPLLGLVAVWFAGRAAIMASILFSPAVVALADLAFLALLGAVIGREIVRGRNWRNLPVLVAVALLWLGNVVFHLEAVGSAAAQGFGSRIGIAIAVFLVVLIGGRIVPSFTRNWLLKFGPGRLPPPMTRFDAAAVIVAAGALFVWIVAPDSTAGGFASIVAAALHAFRLGRWAGWRTGREPLVTILHVGYLFVPLGFLAIGIANFYPGLLAQSAALHAWTAGAVGVMTLAVMTRASLGHTGRALTATPATTAIYAAAAGAAILRVGSGLFPGMLGMLHLSALLWILAFGGFAITFFSILTQTRTTA